MLSNSLIISDTSKTEYFELKFFQIEKKKYGRTTPVKVSAVSRTL